MSKESAYLAPEGFVEELTKELGSAVQKVYDRLVYSKTVSPPPVWSQNTWLEPRFISFDSVSDAARKLKALQRNWAYFPYMHHRRAELIEKQLPYVSKKPIDFLAPLPTAPLGSWTLIEPNLMLVSAQCTSPFAHGEVHFNEDEKNPPSRAYLKLWEFFTLYRNIPSADERCLDLGSSPGGWTGVLQSLGCHVISVDKAPLADSIYSLQNIEVLKRDAFTLKPQEVGPVDWLFSDIICYPTRLLELVQKWRNSGLVHNMVCTIKFQGPTDYESIRAFAAIPGSRLVHLYHNKHELTWFNLAQSP